MVGPPLSKILDPPLVSVCVECTHHFWNSQLRRCCRLAHQGDKKGFLLYKQSRRKEKPIVPVAMNTGERGMAEAVTVGLVCFVVSNTFAMQHWYWAEMFHLTCLGFASSPDSHHSLAAFCCSTPKVQMNGECRKVRVPLRSDIDSSMGGGF